MFKVPWLFLRKPLCLPVSESVFPGLPLTKDSLTMSPSRIPGMGIYPLMGGGLEKVRTLGGPPTGRNFVESLCSKYHRPSQPGAKT